MSCQGRVAVNRGRIYDCGRVPPLPKSKRRNRNRNPRSDDAAGCVSVFASTSSLFSSFTLIRFLTSSHTNRRRNSFSESGWRRRIERGQILVDGIVIKDPDHVLTKAKQRVVDDLCFSNAESSDDDYDYDCDDYDSLKILYIDDHLMAVHKPSGLPTMPSQTFFEYSVLNALRHLQCCKEKEVTRSAEPDNVVATVAIKKLVQSHCSAPPQPVHRLGVGTSGILVIATSVLGRQRLTDAIRLKSHNNNNAIKKTYRALVWAYRRDERPGGAHRTPPVSESPTRMTIPDSMTIDCPIGPVPFPIGGDTIHAACPRDNTGLYGHVRVRVRAPSNDGTAPTTELLSSGVDSKSKPAVSHVTVVRRNHLGGDDETEASATAVVEVEIPTGRPHQIRIHMAYAGYPLVGDPLYLAGGIPDVRPRPFPWRPTEDEDLDTDDDEDDTHDDTHDEHNNDDDVNQAATTTTRVALPRDCGYHLHAYQITLEHPAAGDGAVSEGATMTFTAPPPPLLR
eukprot:jgi/Psemu1/947/gm1.947_g